MKICSGNGEPHLPSCQDNWLFMVAVTNRSFAICETMLRRQAESKVESRSQAEKSEGSMGTRDLVLVVYSELTLKCQREREHDKSQ